MIEVVSNVEDLVESTIQIVIIWMLWCHVFDQVLLFSTRVDCLVSFCFFFFHQKEREKEDLEKEHVARDTLDGSDQERTELQSIESLFLCLIGENQSQIKG